MTIATRTIPRAEHVGSLLRPKRLLDAISQVSSFSIDNARPTDASLDFANADQDAVREIEDECIREAVAKQEAAGLDCVTDGEFRRVFFMGSFDKAVRGSLRRVRMAYGGYLTFGTSATLVTLPSLACHKLPVLESIM